MKPFDVYQLSNVQPVKAQGSWLWDEKGEKYLDMYGGHAVISIGHSHPYYVQKLKEQLDKIAFYSNSVKIDLQEELADKLGRLSGYPSYSLFLCNSGAEANENALKLASFHTGRKKVIAFERSFHGRTSLAVAATDDKKISAKINTPHEVVFLPMNDADRLVEVMNEDVCAVLIEGMQGVAGVIEPEAEFLKLIRGFCDNTGAVMILDEVQSGYGRTGKFFAHQHAGIKPDLITVAKGMGNGFPVAGVLISEKFKAVKGMLGTTFGGNHLACAASIAVLDIIHKENLIHHAAEKGNLLKNEITQVPGVREVRGKGLMLGVEFETEVAELRKQLLEKDRIFVGNASCTKTLRILPALNIKLTEIGHFAERFSERATKFKEEKNVGNKMNAN